MSKQVKDFDPDKIIRMPFFIERRFMETEQMKGENNGL